MRFPRSLIKAFAVITVLIQVVFLLCLNRVINRLEKRTKAYKVQITELQNTVVQLTEYIHRHNEIHRQRIDSNKRVTKEITNPREKMESNTKLARKLSVGPKQALLGDTVTLRRDLNYNRDLVVNVDYSITDINLVIEKKGMDLPYVFLTMKQKHRKLGKVFFLSFFTLESRIDINNNIVCRFIQQLEDDQPYILINNKRYRREVTFIGRYTKTGFEGKLMWLEKESNYKSQEISINI